MFMIEIVFWRKKRVNKGMYDNNQNNNTTSTTTTTKLPQQQQHYRNNNSIITATTTKSTSTQQQNAKRHQRRTRLWANLMSVAIGSDPGERMKIRGDKQLLSAYESARSKAGDSMKCSPMSAAMTSAMAGITLSGLSIFNITILCIPPNFSNDPGNLAL